MSSASGSDSEREVLVQGLRGLDLSLSPDVVDRLLAYRDLLAKWNRAYNLTAVRDPREMIHRHLVDSLIALPHVQGRRILDMGTGAGLPGIPFAIVAPERQFTLLDANGKKTRFCTQAVHELGLDNVEVRQQRAESFQSDPFDTVCSRAFSELALFWSLARPLLKADGVALAMKAEPDERETDALGRTGARWTRLSLTLGERARTAFLIQA
ncbi:MAG: 16S rRNA (guanine(527)-N(7))-methyltransferase RsmG [Gammaproteobacteria bacterium]